MSHITASPPRSPSLAGLWPWLRCSQLSTLSHGEWKGSIIPTQPNVFKDSNECNAVTQKMDFREGEGGEKKAILRLWRSIITLLPSPHPFSSLTSARVCVFVCACASTYIMCAFVRIYMSAPRVHADRPCVCVCVFAWIECVSERLSGWAEISIKREWVQADRQDHCGVN